MPARGDSAQSFFMVTRRVAGRQSLRRREASKRRFGLNGVTSWKRGALTEFGVARIALRQTGCPTIRRGGADTRLREPIVFSAGSKRADAPRKRQTETCSFEADRCSGTLSRRLGATKRVARARDSRTLRRSGEMKAEVLGHACHCGTPPGGAALGCGRRHDASSRGGFSRSTPSGIAKRVARRGNVGSTRRGLAACTASGITKRVTLRVSRSASCGLASDSR